MGVWSRYRLRLRRQRWRLRARRKRRELTAVADRTGAIGPRDVLLLSNFRNENLRLPHFLDYYRAQGIGHFIMVDNGSDDGGREYLAAQPDVSLWSTEAGYKRARFGVDWLNGLAMRYAEGHWCLTVDPDEYFVFPFCDTRPIRALTDWLDASSIKSFSAMLLDMYPKTSAMMEPYRRGGDPLQIACWFDSGNYQIQRNRAFGNLWIQGGPRARVFFDETPEFAPALNKIPLVKWDRACVYDSSTHHLLPRGLNLVYDEWGGEKASGLLLHTKFLGQFAGKAREELERRQHYAASREYKAYAAQELAGELDLWCQWSEKYINWRQLEMLGLMSKGNWA